MSISLFLEQGKVSTPVFLGHLTVSGPSLSVRFTFCSCYLFPKRKSSRAVVAVSNLLDVSCKLAVIASDYYQSRAKGKLLTHVILHIAMVEGSGGNCD